MIRHGRSMTGGFKLKYLGWLGALVYNVRPPVSDHRSEIILQLYSLTANLLLMASGYLRLVGIAEV
jgi:hypothetical protein